MDVYHGNMKAAFRNLLEHPIQLRDWRVALADIIFPIRTKNNTANDYFIFAANVPMKTFSRPDSVGI